MGDGKVGSIEETGRCRNGFNTLDSHFKARFEVVVLDLYIESSDLSNQDLSV